MRTTTQNLRVVETPVHPVQLQFVAARELFLKLYRPLERNESLPEKDVRIESAASAYDPASRTVQVSVQATLGEDAEPTPERLAALLAADAPVLRLKVLLVGQFKVDDAIFPLAELDEWTALGAPLTLYPYLREEVSALTARCAARPLVLPLLQAPTIRPAAPAAAPAQEGDAAPAAAP